MNNPESVAESQRDAFAGLWVEHERSIRALVLGRIRPTWVDDVMQDIALESWQSFATYDTDRPFRPWLARIAQIHLARHARERHEIDDHELKTDALDDASGAL